MASSQKRKKKKARTHSFFLGLAIAVFLGVLSVSTISTCLKISDYNTKISKVQQELESTQNENSELKSYIKTAGKDDIIIRIARDKLGYVMPDERIFYDAG